MTQEQNARLKELVDGVIEANQALSNSRNAAFNAQALVNKLQTELDHFRISLLEPARVSPAKRGRPRNAKPTHAPGLDLLRTANNAATMFADEGRQS